ncbi:MAG: helix-turn-helix domain-containing protein [Bifidobacteriaceae bacterium]|jgi:excisionase family DNA binding protein|nr:helix-turn-helix domain-containing protein [Bifidobacteriaceae bacterium]
MTSTEQLSAHPGTVLLSTSEAAEFLRVPRQTLARWRCDGKGPSYSKIGKHVRYRQADLDAWVETETIHPREVL